MFADRLTTQRLVLRSPVQQDAASLVELLNDWDVVKNLALAPYPYERMHAEEFLERSETRNRTIEDAVFVIAREAQLLGVISVAPQARGASLGYWLGQPFWGRGIMTEAAAAVVAAFFQQTESQLLTSGVFVGNDASLAVQRKFGFEIVGESSVMCVARGRQVAHVDTVLTRDRYEELQL